MDLESYRRSLRSAFRDGPLTYRELGDRLGLSEAESRIRKIALGLVWPAPEIIDAIVRGSGGQVTVDAMHKRRLRVRSESKSKAA